MKGVSKFEYGLFGSDIYCLNKQKFTKEEAIQSALNEDFDINKEWKLVEDCFVRYGYGYDEGDGENKSGWWIEIKDNGKYCPVWLFCKDDNYYGF